MNTTETATTAALTSNARKRVLEVLSRARHPLDAGAVADALGVHVTTARFHLEQLEASGLVQRRATKEKRKGRPRMVYSAAASLRAADAREQLIDVLVRAVGGERAGDARATRTSVSAGKRWADELHAANGARRKDDAVGELVGVLESLGFEPERSERGVLMHACPFRDAARERPDVVCSVHRGMIQRMLAMAPDAPSDMRLIPFVEPELCVIVLGAAATVAATR